MSALNEWLAVSCAFAAAIVMATCVSGCATTESGKKKVDRQLCEERVEQARAAVLGCGLIDDEDNRRRCELSAQMAVIAAELGCSFADDVDGSESAAE